MSEAYGEVRPAGGEPFEIGRVLKRTLDVFGRGFGKFALIAFVVLAPALILKLLAGPPVGPRGHPNYAAALAGLLIILLSIIAQAASLYGAFRVMRNEDFLVPESLRVGLRRFFPVLGVGILIFLASALGFIALVVPAFIVACMFYVAVPACVLENLGVFDSLGRSRALTKGYRWQIFGVFALVMIVSLVASALVAVLARVGFPFFMREIVQFAWQVALSAFGAVLVAVVYHDLRAAKEGVDTERISQVFD